MAPGPTFPARGKTPLSECSPVLSESVVSSKVMSHVLVGNALVFPLEGFRGVVRCAALSHKAGLRPVVIVLTAVCGRCWQRGL
ncbi:ring-box 1, isoform CRA_c [Rattus norvegicus]|uniref:Ring-box 1, isoform CRA_c n=1 Tax=Rattus norvegicus TaxID=10116 RepID=A6HT02_RAT|nr:ring-box 1, isoform CRA_c [Rattus norvegicus]